jgi:hypothetical protein
MKNIRVKHKQITLALSFLDDLGYEFKVISYDEMFLTIQLTEQIVLTLSQVNTLVKGYQHLASILWYFYSTNNLRILGLEYPTYQDYQTKFFKAGCNVNHILPRREYPELTFDCSNWEMMNTASNRLSDLAAKKVQKQGV